jgi:hypothetical protein
VALAARDLTWPARALAEALHDGQHDASLAAGPGDVAAESALSFR